MCGLGLGNIDQRKSASLTESWTLICIVKSYKKSLIPFINEKLPNHPFMQDNDPKHIL